METFVYLGKLFGILGITLFSLTLVLNTRLKFLDQLFGGLNKLFPIHHQLGRITFGLLLFHPILITTRNLSFSVQSAFLFLLPGSDRAVNFGIFALGLLIILLIITFYVRLPYNHWISVHRFLGIAFFLAALHIFTIDSDIAFNQPLRAYVGIVTGAGLLAYLYRTVLSRFLVKKYRYLVNQVNWLNPEVAELILSPQKEKLNYNPGQFIFIEFKKSLPDEQHPFSLTSSPKDKNLRLVIKVLGDFTSLLKELPVKTPVEVEGSFGSFGKADNPKGDQVWVAGGIGITPFLSLARSLGENHPEIYLIYSVTNKQEAIFLSELSNLSSKDKGFHLYPWFSEKRGRLDIEAVKGIVGNIQTKEFFLCGPILMIRSFKDQLFHTGMPKQQIHSEEFRLV